MERIRFLLLVASLMLAAFPAFARSVQNPSQCDPIVVVHRGDMFSILIARHFGKHATWTQFTRFNRHITDPNLIVPGDEICVPKAEILFGKLLPPALERVIEMRVAARLGGQQRQPDPAATPDIPPAHLDSALIASSCAMACATSEFLGTCLVECNSYFTLNQGKDYTSLLGKLFREIYDLRRATAHVSEEPAVAPTATLPSYSHLFAIGLTVFAFVLLFALAGDRVNVRRLKKELTDSEELAGQRERERKEAASRAEKTAADFEAVERANVRAIRDRDSIIIRLSGTEAGRTIQRLDGDVARLTADLEEAQEARTAAERRAKEAEARMDSQSVSRSYSHIRGRLLQLIRARRGAISFDDRAAEKGRLDGWIARLDELSLNDEARQEAFRTIGEEAQTHLVNLVPTDGEAAGRHDRGEMRFLEDIMRALGTDPTRITRQSSSSAA